MRKKLKNILNERTILATVFVTFAIMILFLTVYYRIAYLVENRCIQRMEEGANTSIEEINQKLNRDSHILNAAASIIANNDDLSDQAIYDTMRRLTPLVETMTMCVLLPNNKVIKANGEVVDGTGMISYDELVGKGEFISDREISLIDDNAFVLRHYVPIEKDGDTVALLYGVTMLSGLPSDLNIDNIYNADASVYIIDRENGELIMDTWHEDLGKISDIKIKKTKAGMVWDDKLKEILAGEKGYVAFMPENSAEWTYLYYTPSNVNNWAIAISVQEKNAFANLISIRRIFSISAIFLLAIILVYYIWVYKNTRYAVKREVEQAVLEEKLHKAEAAEKAKTMFLSNMSHDIRTPMNVIIGFTTLAETNIDNKERVQEYLSKILSASNHLLRLINDVLDMSRIESGRLNIEESECNISDIFKDMRNIIQTQMNAKQLNFFMDTVDVVDEDIYCDKLHINQVLLNLLGNSIKFTPAGGSVSLTIKQLYGAPKGYGSYEIRVKDTGIGMSQEFVKHLFEPFERERTSTVSGIQGTGLGMPISKSIIEAMGGTIQVETEKGKGTEFIINLEFRLANESRHIEVIRELEGLRALVVDDNFTTCDSVTKMMMQIGMRSEWTMHGKEAVLRAKQAVEMGDAFYAYIIDWNLPDLGGIEVARQVRQVVGDDAPIIILTAYDWSIIEDEARKAGVTAFCNKPIFLSELRDTLVKASKKSSQPEKEQYLPDVADELKGKRILLVEDIELNRELAAEILNESGFIVESAENGKVAVEMIENSTEGYYDLVLMDIQMPVMDGYEATKAIRSMKNKKLADIPIIAMTANAFDEDRQMALDAGMDEHVSKPIDVVKVMDVIYKILKSDDGEQLGEAKIEKEQ